MSVLEKNTIGEGQVNKSHDPEFEVGNNKKYFVETIWDNTVYGTTIKDQLLGLYYLVYWKIYLESKNTLEPTLVIPYPQKLIISFHKKYPEKLISISLSLNSALSIVYLLIKLMVITETPKQKQGCLMKGINKRVIKWWARSFNLSYWRDSSTFYTNSAPFFN